MAIITTTHLSFPLLLSPYPHHQQQYYPKPNPTVSFRRSIGVRAQGGVDELGDFGARDPFPAEVASGFADKGLGNVDTEHKILIPNISALSFSAAVVGWRLLEEEGGLKLQCLWKLRDSKCGVELINRIYKVVEAAGHYPNIHLEAPNQVRAEIWTASIGGLSMNDFIVAAKIDDIKTSDLVPRKRVWA
ncbi:hypothetical protein ACJW30_12G114800 [Castanea mollissima]